MGKKKNQDEPPPAATEGIDTEQPPPEPDQLAEDREAIVREDTIQQTIETLLSRVYMHIDEAELQKTVPSTVVTTLLSSALEIVELGYVAREDHCTSSMARGELHKNWLVDSEPVPAPIDRWARGSVPTRRRSKSPAASDNPEKSTNRSLTGNRSHRTSFASSTGLLPGQRKPTKDPVRMRPVGQSSFARKLTAEEAEREQRLRDEIEARRQAEELQRQQAEKDEHEVRRLETLQKDLRGKDYGYDHKGNVIVLSKVDPERLPAYMVGPRVSLLPTEEELAAMEAEAAKNARRSPDTQKKKKKAEPKKKKETDSVEYVQQEDDGQKSMLDSMVMNTGVTLREGALSKPGPRVPLSEERMSRRQFMALIGQEDHPSLGPSTDKASDKENTKDGKSGFDLSDLPGQRQPTPDWTKDATVVPPSQDAESVYPDVNELLVKAPDWGLNPSGPPDPYSPPAIPHKVSDKERESALGKLVKNPRERPFIAPTGMKKAHFLGVSDKPQSTDPPSPTSRSPNNRLAPL